MTTGVMATLVDSGLGKLRSEPLFCMYLDTSCPGLVQTGIWSLNSS